MFKVIAFSKLYPVCQTDENGIRPGSNLNTADKRVAESPRALNNLHLILNDSYKNASRISSLLGKIVIFLYTGKIIQVLVFDNWHPLNSG